MPKWLLQIPIIICLVAQLYASGMHLPAIGARGTAMGGAMRAAANDPTAIFWNPACLSEMKSSRVTFIGQMFYNNVTYTFDDTLIAINNAFRRGENEMKENVFKFGHGFAVFTPKSLENLKIGMGIYTFLGVGSTWDIMRNEIPDSDYVVALDTFGTTFYLTVTEQLPGDEFKARIGAYTFAPTVSYDFGMVSVGLGFLASYSILDIDMPASDLSRMEADTGLIFQTASLTGYGLGGNIGILIKPMDNLKIGATGRWEMPYKYTGKYNYTIYKFYLDHFLINLPGGKEEYRDISSKAELPRPYILGAGIAYDPIGNLTLSLDYEYTHWSALDTVFINTEDTDSTLESINLMWENESRISGGVEYRFLNYAARAGIFFEPYPAVPEFQNVFLPDMNDKLAYTFGFGAMTKRIDIEIAGEYECFGKKIVEPYFEEEVIKNMAGEYNGYVIDICLSMTYKF